MDWTHTFTIIGALGAFVIYVSSRTDKRIETFETRSEASNKALNEKIDFVNKTLNDKIDSGNKALSDKIEATVEKSKKELKTEIRDLDKKIEGVQKDLNQIAINVSNIEGQITQMTRPGIPIERYQQQYTQPPEDGDGEKKAQGQ